MTRAASRRAESRKQKAEIFGRRGNRAFLISAFCFLLFGCRNERPPQTHTVHRIVTLAPNVTEMVFALGSGSMVAGTDDYSDFPPAAKALPKIGGIQPNVERIAALKPDLVIANAAGMHPSLRRALDAIHVRVEVVRNERVNDVITSMNAIAALLDSPNRAAVVALQDAINAQRHARAKPPRVMLAVWTDPLYVAGRETFGDDLFTICGATNVVEVKGWPQYSLETFVEHPPDLLLYPNRSVTKEAIDKLLARARPGIIALPVDENVFTRPGPRMSEAARQLNGILDRWEHSRR